MYAEHDITTNFIAQLTGSITNLNKKISNKTF